MSSFRAGDHVSWNAEAHRVTGFIIEICSADIDFNGLTHHATQHEPRYFIKPDNSDDIAIHSASALTKIDPGLL
ncbi:MAG: DUF2945 domain-containing protein [Candidatus Melainabacteria bacterium]|nr:MAG: DUF2945 domain-containing protein [Candidatus Melainabacteria bacterium]